jgi:UDP-2,3-diacylglucosamine pyrophosphatase LpxH
MSGRLAFVGDVHLEPDDPLLSEFLEFLEQLGRSCSRIVFTGDLFTVWLGRPELEQPHHVAVLSKLSELREQGVVLRYIEGNHDFRIGDGRAGAAFDDVGHETLCESFGGLSILIAHGDLANSSDRRYRRWRRFARCPLIWGLFNLLPRRGRISLAEATERRMRSTNLDHKREFPEEQVLAYAASFLEAGHDIVVLGHFHEERDLVLGGTERSGRVVVLPEWKGSRRHLEVSADGDITFVDYRPGGS